MRTAYCFTPDRAFFVAAARAIASLIEAEPEVYREIFLRARRVTPGFDRLPSRSRERIKLMTLDFPRFDGPPRRQRPFFPRGAIRRLFLDEILPKIWLALNQPPEPVEP